MHAKDLGDGLLGVGHLDVAQVRFRQDKWFVAHAGGLDRLRGAQRDGSIENGRRDIRARELAQDHAAVAFERREP